MRAAFAFLKQNQALLYSGLLIVLLLTQFAGISAYVAVNSDEQGVIAATDNDAEWVIRKVVHTRWWKDNGWAHYGPLYMRTAHSLQYFLNGMPSSHPGVDPAAEIEKTGHFAAQEVAVISLFGLALLLSWVAVSTWPWRLLTMIGLVAVFTSNPVWAEFILRAHPDHMFALVCAAAALATLHWLRERADNSRLMVMSLLWGLAVAVKLTVAVIAPGLILLFVPPFRRRQFEQFAKFIGWAFLAYFVIGFPQTINLGRPFRFLLEQNQYTQIGDAASLAGWLTNFGQQLWKPTLVLLAAFLLDGPKRIALPRDSQLRYLAFVLVPLVYLFARKILVPSQHYTFPFVGFTLLGIIFLLPTLASRAVALRRPAVLAVLIIAICWIGVGSSALQAQLDRSMTCRTQVHATYDKVIEIIDHAGKILLDPYFPYRASLLDGAISVAWTKSLKTLDEQNFTAIGVTKDYYIRYLGQSIDKLVRTDDPEWLATRDLYLALDGKEDFSTPNGRHFHRVYSDDCGHSIYQWMKQ